MPEYAEILFSALIKLGLREQAQDLAAHAMVPAEQLDLPGQLAHAVRTGGLLAALRGDYRGADADFSRPPPGSPEPAVR